MSHRTEWICIALVGVFWGGYPLIARLSDLGGPFGSLVLAALSLVPIAATVLWTGDSAWPTRAQLWPIAIAGVMQGVGLMAFLRVASGKLEASVSIPIADAAMMMVTALGAILFFQEAVSAQKIAGFALLIAGIWLLRPA